MEYIGLEETCGDHLVQSPAKEGWKMRRFFLQLWPFPHFFGGLVYRGLVYDGQIVVGQGGIILN